MRQQILAIYKKGVFHPLKPLNFPEGTVLNIEIVEILGDSSDYMKYLKKDLSELEESGIQTSQKDD